ncbi:MAG: hypothetical protein K2X64_01940 [Rhodocyclaceae bacterium]|nr:hypothetical protein [Rhodocyclaceae bacterium]
MEAVDMGASLLVVFNGLRLLRGRRFAVLRGVGLLSSGCCRSAIWPRMAGAGQKPKFAALFRPWREPYFCERRFARLNDLRPAQSLSFQTIRLRKHADTHNDEGRLESR